MEITLEMETVLNYGLSLLSGILILGAGWIIGKYTQNAIKKFDQFDKTLGSFLGGFAKYTIFAFSGVIVLGQFGVETASLIAVLGAAGLAIGLALQGTLTNIAAGVMMLVLRPFNVGDYIDFGETGGTVKSLGLFGTELATPDNVYVFAPNSTVWNSTLFNYSRNTQRRMDIDFGIGYSEDIGKAIKAIQKVLDNEKSLVTTEGKQPTVMTAGMGASSVDLKARFWCNASDYWDLKWNMTKAIKETLDKEGIDIPFPTRTIINKNETAEAANDSKAKASKKAA